MSIILRPDIDISQVSNITSFTAVACSRAIENLCDCCVGIKWVNDLFINGKKICGILAEAATEPKTRQMTYVVIGIGIDLLHAEPPEELINVISSVEDQTGKRISREELIAEILNRFNGFQNSLCSKTYMEEYRTRSIIIGKSIKVVSSNETFEAIARQIDDTGALIVEHDGILRKINAGEVSIRF